MNRHERGLEFKVGIFVFVGLAVLGALLVRFGRLGEGFKTYYTITVRFNDASGLIKVTDVLLAGARIGKVADGPKLLREGDGVAVPLKIYDYIKIPEGAKFTVGSSGLLGDRFVNVAIPPGPQKAYLPPNADIKGARETGIDDLTRSGGALVNDLQLSNDLHALVSNLRAHGVLFYRDSAAGRQPAPSAQTTPSRKAQSR